MSNSDKSKITFKSFSLEVLSANFAILLTSSSVYKSIFLLVLNNNISFVYFIISQVKLFISFPSSINLSIVSNPCCIFFSKIASTILLIYSVSGIPTKLFTFCTSISLLPSCIQRSNMLKASLIAPSANDAIVFSASFVIFTLLSLQTYSSQLAILLSDIFLKSNLWHLDKIVAGNFWGSVVANINLTCSGGSSNVFNNALKAPVDNICTSSII